MHTYMHTGISIYIHAYLHTYIRTHTSIHTCIYIYIYIYIYKDMIWFHLVLWNINHCRLFNAKSISIRINSFISRDELTKDVLLWTPTHGRAKAGRPARTYIQQLCEDTGCCPEDLPRAMNDCEEWRERVRDIRATSAI